MIDYRNLPIGISNFAKVIEDECILIDKTMLIKDIMVDKSNTILITRPRRFGKTLAMTMMGEFFSLTGKDVFGGLNILKEKEFCQKHQNQYPVISISFKDCKGRKFGNVFEQAKETFKDCYAHHGYLLQSPSLSTQKKQEFENVLNGEIEDSFKLAKALKNLISYIHDHTGKNVVVLIDEYDSPIHSAYEHGFYEDMVEFMRALLGSALKDNPFLEKSVITGICRVSQESLFSGLNHVQTYTVLDERYAQYFGFTQDEVESLIPPSLAIQDSPLAIQDSPLAIQTAPLTIQSTPFVIQSEAKDPPLVTSGEQTAHNTNERQIPRGFAPLDDNGRVDTKRELLIEDIKGWYNGYAIGGLKIYNPWSILECLSRNNVMIPYWVNTSDNSLVHKLINGSRESLKESFEELIEGIPQRRVISNNLAFKYLENDDDAIWTLLIHAGYLNVSSKTIDEAGRIHAILEIPNKEVMSVYIKMVENWFTTQRYSGSTYEKLILALETGDIDAFAQQIQEYILESGSYFDFTKRTPERVFHVFMLGILVGMRHRYDITSNRERGLGRADMVMVPKDSSKPSIVLEFKSCKDPQKLEEEAGNALAQIKQKRYASGSATLVSMVFCDKEMVYKFEKIGL